MLPEENLNCHRHYSTIRGILVDFLCTIDATNTIVVIIKSELGHYYLANKNTFSLFLSSIDTIKESCP